MPTAVEKSTIGTIKFLCTPQQSLKITGNGIGGHDRIVWDRRYMDQIEEARKKFYELLDQKWLAFLTRADGSLQDRQITRFDPNAEEIVMVAPVRGG